jgi:SAM-dependent methyltransferase
VPGLRADENDLREIGAYYDTFAEAAEERYTSNHVLVRVREAFRRAVEPHPAASVLDLGCGPGTDLAWFAERYPGRRYAGIDVSARMVELARANLSARAVRVERGCAQDIPRLFPGERFDLVYSFFGPLNTEPDLERAIAALAQAVAPGGVLVLTFVSRTYLVDAALHLLRGRPRQASARFTDRWRGYSDKTPLDTWLYFPRQIEARFAPAFQVERREGFSILYPAWYRAARFRQDGRLVRALWIGDRLLNRTRLWSTGEHLLYVLRRAPSAEPAANPGYAAFHAPRYAFLLEVLAREVRMPRPRLLDIGRSELTAMIAGRLDAPVDSLGLEPDATLPSGRHHRFDLNDAQHRERWRTDLGSYDAIVFAEVLEHLHTAPELVLAYLRSLLAPHGLLFVQTPNAAALWKRLRLLGGRNPYERIRVDPTNPGHFREYTARELEAIVAGAGFGVRQSWTRFYFDSRHERHQTGQEPPSPIKGAIKNVVYRWLPASLREGITLVAERRD